VRRVPGNECIKKMVNGFLLRIKPEHKPAADDGAKATAIIVNFIAFGFPCDSAGGSRSVIRYRRLGYVPFRAGKLLQFSVSNQRGGDTG